MTARPVALLIVGGESDPNTQRIVDQSHLRGVDYVFWNTDLAGARQIAWDFNDPVIDLGDQSLSPRSVYLRYNVFDGQPAHNHAAHDAIESFALTWPEIRLLNRQTLGSGNNKSANLRLARSIGFEIPETTVLGDLTPLSSIPNPGEKIIKPIAGGDHAVVVDEIRSDTERLMQLVPQFVQERLAGENLRVFSIGGKLHGFHLETKAVDYRTDDDVRVRAIDVPADLVTKIGELVRRIGFDYCALDFRCRNGFDDPVFLEVNSFPMFVAFDDAAENRLADAILEVLTG